MITNAFVPLIAPLPAAPPSTNGASTKTAADPGPVKVFRPMDDGAAACSSASHLSGEPKVTLERDGDRVTRIHIQCACGQTLELDCAY
jgi:hypothetical protein